MSHPARSLGLTLCTLALATSSAATRSSTRASTVQSHFWAVIDRARDGSSDCEKVSNRLEQQLKALADPALEEFAGAWSDWWGTTYSWDMWGVAYLINGGSSDDGFDYFRGWLMTQGSRRWAKVLQGPDSAFDDVTPGTVAECEDIVVVLPNVYEGRFRRAAPDPGQREPNGQEWTEETLKSRFPRLARRFGGGG